MHNKLEESPLAGPHTHMEPANGFPSTADGWLGCSESLKAVYMVRTIDSVEYPNDGLDKVILAKATCEQMHKILGKADE